MIQQLGLIGCGLMGGSLALALKRAGLVQRVVGFSPSQRTRQTALELGVIQRGGFPFHTPDSFRKILEGKKANAFTYWIRSVRFKSGAPS